MRLQALHHVRGQRRVGATPAATPDDQPPLVVSPSVAALPSATTSAARVSLVSVATHGRRAYAACELPCPGMASMSLRV
jgi:hypothetical protein